MHRHRKTWKITSSIQGTDDHRPAFDFLAAGWSELVTHINYRSTVLYSLFKNGKYKLYCNIRCYLDDIDIFQENQ